MPRNAMAHENKFKLGTASALYSFLTGWKRAIVATSSCNADTKSDNTFTTAIIGS